MSDLRTMDREHERAMEFMRRFSNMVVKAATGEWAEVDETQADIEQQLGITKDEAVAILERRLRPN